MRDLDKYQADYAEHAFESVQAGFRRRKTMECLRHHRPRRVLEVGCGLSPLCTEYTDFDSMHIVEPSGDFFAAAQQCIGDDARVHLHRGTIEECAPQLQAGFDFIVVSGLLHEVDEPGSILDCVRRLCLPETVVHVTVPNARSLHRLLALEMGLISQLHELSDAQRRLQQHRTFDLERLTALLEGCGFDVIESGSLFVKPFTHAQMASLSESGFLSAEMLEGLFGLAKHIPEFGSEIFVNAKTGNAVRNSNPGGAP